MSKFSCLSLLCLLFSADLAAQECASTPNTDTPYGTGWGHDATNTRFQSVTQIDRSNVDQLGVQWVFKLDGGMSPHSYFTVSKDTLFVGSQAGSLFALARDSGCIRWQSKVESSIRTGLTHAKLADGRIALFFGTFDGITYAVDAENGQEIWRAKTKVHPFGVNTGTPSYADGKLFVPVSSMELGLAINPLYGCCTFRGSLVALDAQTGAELWRGYTIDEEPAVSGRHWLFVEEMGPSGAPIWLSPTIDSELGFVYVGTGENYTAPASEGSDAIIAYRIADGSKAWVTQYTAGDTFNMSCVFYTKHPNCPDEVGPDLDFGAPPIRTTGANGKPILLAGQKSGDVHAIDPLTGTTLWSKNLGRGGYLGGVHWGMAIHPEQKRLYVPISDIPAGPVEGAPQPGIHAVDISTGGRIWLTPSVSHCNNREGCRDGMSAAITATPELLFAGALDGMMYAYDIDNGAPLWSYDTWKTFEAMNSDEPAEGGAIDVHGPFIADDQMFVQSGYGSFGQKGGNALIAFKLKSPEMKQ